MSFKENRRSFGQFQTAKAGDRALVLFSRKYWIIQFVAGVPDSNKSYLP